MTTQEYIVTVRGYGCEAACKIQARSEKEAKEKAARRYGISIEARETTREENELRRRRSHSSISVTFVE